MPQQFRKIFKTGKIRAHVARRADGLFLIRCQINKVRITATSRTLDVCKERFIEKLSLLSSQPTIIQEQQPKQKHTTLFVPYMKKWLESSKKPFVKDVTYKDYIQTMNAYSVILQAEYHANSIRLRRVLLLRSDIRLTRVIFAPQVWGE